MVVVSVCSLKGGVGKTSLVLGLADAARRRGTSTLVVDLDPQGDATFALGVRPGEADVSDVLTRPKRRVLEETVCASAWAGSDAVVHVMPATESSAALDRPDASGRELHGLRTALGKVDYDLVLIDAPPSLSGLTRSALVASDRVIIVAEPSAFAVNAASRLLRSIDDVRRREAGGLQPLGIVVNRYRPAVKEHLHQTKALEQLFGPLVLGPPIPERTVMAQAQSARRPISEMPGAAELSAVYDKHLDRIVRIARKRRGR